MVAVSLVAAMAMIGIGTISLGMLYTARAKVVTAAESGALAAAVATYPPAADHTAAEAAVEMVELNDATLVACSCVRDISLQVRSVVVTASIDVDVPIFGHLTVRSSARAEFDPRAWLGR